ncbi:MAG TPA: hypoxanthine phosphoribosyltransferase, partial [Paenibacillus sp.]
MQNDIQEVLITEEELQQKIKELGQKLSEEYAGRT